MAARPPPGRPLPTQGLVRNGSRSFENPVPAAAGSRPGPGRTHCRAANCSVVGRRPGPPAGPGRRCRPRVGPGVSLSRRRAGGWSRPYGPTPGPKKHFLNFAVHTLHAICFFFGLVENETILQIFYEKEWLLDFMETAANVSSKHWDLSGHLDSKDLCISVHTH